MGGWFVAISCLLVMSFAGESLFAAPNDTPSTTQERSGGFLSGTPQTSPEPAPSVGGAFLRVMTALVVVLVVVLILAYVLRRVSARLQRDSGGVITVIAQVPLGPSQFLSVVDVAGSILVLGVTQQSVTAISEIEDPALIEQLRRNIPQGGSPLKPNLAGIPSFRQWLQKAGEPD
jgi:flagellar protein FliO/FliZ